MPYVHNSPVNNGENSQTIARFWRSDSLLKRKLLGFLPFMLLTNLSLLLITSVDGVVVGNLVGADALSSVNIVLPITSILGVASALIASGIGTTLSTGMGENHFEDLRYQKKVAKTLTLLSVLGLCVLEFPVAAMMIRFYHLSHDMNTLVWNYTAGILIASPFGLVSTICVFELQILGKTKVLTALAIGEGLINLVLDLLFVGVFHLGVAGAGYGTAVANVVRCVCSVVYLSRKTDIYATGDERIRGKDILRMLRTGLSEASYSAMLALENFFIVSILLATFGEIFGVINGVCRFCLSIANVVIISVQNSARPLIGILTGGRDVVGVKMLMRKCIYLMIGLLGIITAFVLVAPELFYHLHHVMDIPPFGVICLRLYTLHFIFRGINAVLRLYFGNRGDVTYNSMVTVAGYATLPLFAFILSRVDAPMFYGAYFITECLLLIVNILHYRTVIKKDLEKRSPEEDILYLTVTPQDAIEASRSVREYAEAHGYTQRIAYRAALCIEEMVHYAEATKNHGQVNTQVMVKFYEGGCVFTIMDDGQCIMLNEDDASRDIVSNYSVIRKIADTASYQYVLDMNYSVFTFEQRPPQGVPDVSAG